MGPGRAVRGWKQRDVRPTRTRTRRAANRVRERETGTRGGGKRETRFPLRGWVI